MKVKEPFISEFGEEALAGQGCIILDLGCFCPYTDAKDLLFRFKLNGREPDDYKVNHRYPNKGYATISMKIGRRVSSLGYPVFVELGSEQELMVEMESRAVRFAFPVRVALTEDKPVCGLRVHMRFENAGITASSWCKAGDGWHRTAWAENGAWIPFGEVLPLGRPVIPEGGGCPTYGTPLRPYPQALDELMIL